MEDISQLWMRIFSYPEDPGLCKVEKAGRVLACMHLWLSAFDCGHDVSSSLHILVLWPPCRIRSLPSTIM